MTENSKGVLIEPTKLFCLFYEDFEIAGCVKIYKKPRDTDSRGKYIPKHKRGPDVELFKGQRNSGTSPFIFYPSIGGIFINGSIFILRLFYRNSVIILFIFIFPFTNGSIF